MPTIAGQALVGGQPRRIEPVVARGRAEIPHPRLAVAGQEAPARELVARPLADDRARDVADVVLVEHEQRAQARFRERLARARETIVVQAAEIDALLEIHLHVAGRLQRPVPAVAGIGRIVKNVRRAADALLRIDIRCLDGFRFSAFLCLLPCCPSAPPSPKAQGEGVLFVTRH